MHTETFLIALSAFRSVRNIHNLKCSVTCGMGTKTRSAICVHQQQIVNFAQCKDQPKPKDIYINCSMDPCYRKVFFCDSLLNTSVDMDGNDWLLRLWRAKLILTHTKFHSLACSMLNNIANMVYSTIGSHWFCRSTRQIQYYMPMKFHRELSIVTIASIINRKHQFRTVRPPLLSHRQRRRRHRQRQPPPQPQHRRPQRQPFEWQCERQP